MSHGFKVTAIIAAYNEADILYQVIEDLVQQGIFVYLVDNLSTDGSGEIVRPLLGKGLIEIERFPQGPRTADVYAHEHLMRRKEALAAELDSDWFIAADADEFRESPWLDKNLKEGIFTVDRLGYNAIDFHVLNFLPTHDHHQPGDDVRHSFGFYQPGQVFDRLQIRCWKKTDSPVDLASTGGHEARFPDRKIFPLRFLLRHYPIRGQAHGEQKVFVDRKPRFPEEERKKGWHVQYDAITPGHRFIWDSSVLIEYDPERARLDLLLRHRGVEEVEARLRTVEKELLEARHELVRRDPELARIRLLLAEHECELQRRASELRRQDAQRVKEERALRECRSEAEQLWEEREKVLSSRTWRWSSMARNAWRLLGRP